MQSPRFSPLRAVFAALLAFAQPAMAALSHCPPGRAVPEAMCRHGSAPAHERHVPGEKRSHPTADCATCCCVPSTVLVSSRLDPAVLFSPTAAKAVLDHAIRVLVLNPPPRLHPYANAPPLVA